jgi:hypothetical protein
VVEEHLPLKSIPGSSFEPASKTWMVPHRSANELKAALSTIEPLADKIVAAEKAKQDQWAAEKEAQRKQWAAERAASAAARDAEMAKVRASRIAVHRSDNVKVGDAVMIMGKVAVVESFGREFRADDSFPSVHGSRWLGHEGERARYAYTREATPAETEAYHVKQAAEKAEQQAKAAAYNERATALRSVQERFNAAEVPTGLAGHPKGETLLRLNQQSEIYGGGERFVLDADGKHLWRIIGNGADGDNWGANNVPGAIAKRIPVDPDMLAQLQKAGGTPPTTPPAPPAPPVPIASEAEAGMKAANEAAAARVTIEGKGPAGWSDAAREKSAEVRAADAKPEAAAAPAREVRVVVDRIPVMDTARFEHMQRIATIMAETTTLPQSLCMERNENGEFARRLPHNTVLANCFQVVNQAVRWGMLNPSWHPFCMRSLCSFWPIMWRWQRGPMWISRAISPNL